MFHSYEGKKVKLSKILRYFVLPNFGMACHSSAYTQDGLLPKFWVQCNLPMVWIYFYLEPCKCCNSLLVRQEKKTSLQVAPKSTQYFQKFF